uniref:WW domain binding protein VOPP1 n=1 Tax=Arion vulgaris TaxID=1028688 RepID=A0A0B7BU41_9EUPU
MAWLATISLLTIVCEAFADYCGENIFCHTPYRCCDQRKGCCYDVTLVSNKHIRPQIWNMWYFWFLIIFMMMSCFGGCGYYRRRRMALLTRVPNHLSARHAAVISPMERRSSRGSDGSSRQFNFFAYNGPGSNLPVPFVSNLPPPYAEVVDQPDLYPINKLELPPYPGSYKPDDYQAALLPPGSSTLPPHESSLPPPYCEYSSEPPQLPLPVVQNDSSSHYVPSHRGHLEQPSAESSSGASLTANSTSTSNSY